MNWLAKRKITRSRVLESLENRELLDVGLGSEIAAFADESELKAAIMDKAVEQHQWLFGQEQEEFFWRGDWGGGCITCFGGDVLLPPGAPEVAFTMDAAAPDFSDTNTQVEGVDEGDIVETDGNYVYILSENLVTVVDVRDQDHPRIASRVHLSDETYGSEMYLDGDRLMVISTGYYFDYISPPRIQPFVDFAADIAFWEPSRAQTVVTVIDVSDREDATIVSETEIDGTVSNSRAIDGTGYLVVSDNMVFPAPELNSVKLISEDGTIERTVNIYETEEEYRNRVEPIILDVMPNYSTYDQDRVKTETGLISDFTTTFSTKDPSYSSIVSVVTIDMN